MALTNANQKYYFPITQVMEYLEKVVIQPTDKVLEIGPGEWPFKRADVSIDFADIKTPGIKKLVKCDVCSEKLPFADKEFDFVFARQIVEDLYDPFTFCEEMSRVGKQGYIETPSQMAEICRGTDGSSPPYRGYYHHRWICWAFGKELRFIAKFPLLEYMQINETRIEELLKSDRYWNSYYTWDDKIITNHRQPALHYEILRDYPLLLGEAVERSKEMTDIFFSNITKG